MYIDLHQYEVHTSTTAVAKYISTKVANESSLLPSTSPVKSTSNVPHVQGSGLVAKYISVRDV